MKNIGRVLKIVRHANNMTLNLASLESGVSTVYISELERGTKINISEECLKKLATGYGLQPYHITELEDYYTNLCVDEERKFRLTLMKTLQMMESNYERGLLQKLLRIRTYRLISLTDRVEKANEIFEQHLGNVDFKEKIAFIKGVFDVGEIIDRKAEATDERMYYLLLAGIVEKI